MKLYLNEKEHSIQFLHLLDLMLNNAIESSKLNLMKLTSITETIKYDDPILEFLNYYIEDSNSQDLYPKGRVQWIKNALCKVKGFPEVINIIESALGIKIEYTYDSYNLDITKIEQLSVNDISVFYDKFYNLMYYLLFIDSFKMAIEELIIRLNDKLPSNTYVGVKGFNIVETTYIGNI